MIYVRVHRILKTIRDHLDTPFAFCVLWCNPM